MKSGNNEFLGLLCKLYMVALLVALPLYIGEGYWNMGDTKYMLFRNVSFLCLGLWLMAGMPGRIKAFVLSVTKGKKPAAGMSAMDWAVAAYGSIVVLSAICSDYGRLAWDGYSGWFMGAVSQLLLVGTYFFLSRQYDGARWPLYLGEFALFLVTLLGLLHRLGIDPLGLLIYWNSGDWEYSHMLSTLGNINWLCGYYSVALAFLVVHFLQEKRVWIKVLLYVGTVATFVLLGVQGSQGGWLILIVCVAVSLFLGRKNQTVRKSLYGLLAGFFFCMLLMGLGMWLRGDKAAVVADGNVFVKVKWYIWILAGMISLGACLLCGRVGQSSGYRRQRKLVKIVLISGGLIGLSLGVLVLLGRGIDDSFGSGRGFLWRIALESFRAADGKDKLLGAGPDCYAEAVFNRLGANSDVWKGEHWETAVFTNAHSEFLSQLCNIGILGTASYLAIFLIGLYQCFRGICQRQDCLGSTGKDGPGEKAEREGKAMEANRDNGGAFGIGLMAIAMYGAHGLISFQQVLNAPFFFLVLGLCESGRRGWSHGIEEEKAGEDNEVEKV